MRLLVIPADGIGPEIVRETVRVLEAADRRFGLGLAFDEDVAGFASLARYGTTLRPELLEKARGYDGIILGPQSHLDYPPVEQGGLNIALGFRGGLDLYANVRPARTWPGVPHRGPDFDLVIMREATEGFYPNHNMHKGQSEFMPTPDVAMSIRKITRAGSRRIAVAAFEWARRRRRKVTAVHKANNFKLTCGLFLEEARAVGRDYPDVVLEERIVDAMAAYLVRDPAQFDVICATNFYGDILSDLASELSGSLGLAGSINASETLCCAQAQHGSAPDIEGQNRANPTSMILSAAMLLDWLAGRHGRPDCAAAAQAIEAAVGAVLADPVARTPDLGGQGTTSGFGEAVVARLA